MKSLCLLLPALFVVPLGIRSCLAQEMQPLPRVRADGFVYCSDPAKAEPVAVYAGICKRRQVGTLNCGDKVEVVSRHGDMLAIASSERPPRRLVSASAISRQPDKFVAFDDQSGVPEGREPDCSQLLARENAPDGFVFCSGHQESAPVYLNAACHAISSGSVACGEKVRVFARRGDMLQVSVPPSGLPRAMPSSSVSQQPDKFVQFDDESGVPDKGVPDCPAGPDRSITPPRATYAPPPEFSEEARKKKINGTVVLSLTVGVDGLPHDIKVEKGVGYGLDEKAVECVSRWKFEPAIKDGQPIERRISAEVDFHLY